MITSARGNGDAKSIQTPALFIGGGYTESGFAASLHAQARYGTGASGVLPVTVMTMFGAAGQTWLL
jgi:hypothetical protein